MNLGGHVLRIGRCLMLSERGCLFLNYLRRSIFISKCLRRYIIEKKIEHVEVLVICLFLVPVFVLTSGCVTYAMFVLLFQSSLFLCLIRDRIDGGAAMVAMEHRWRLKDVIRS